MSGADHNTTTSRGEGGFARGTIPWIGLAFLSLIHAAGLASLFDPVGGLLNAEPLIEQDYGLHFHHLNSLEAFWEGDGRLWGYNPLFMAGYPSNTIQDASIKLFDLVSVFMPGGDPVRVFKLLVFAGNALIPLCAFLTGLLFFSDRRIATAASILGTLYWWNSLPREMFFYGMVGFPLASYFSVLALGVFYRLTSKPGDRSLRTHPHALGLAWTLCVALLLPLHLQSVVIVGPPLAVLFILQLRTMGRARIAWAVGGLAFGIIANLFWLGTYVAHRSDDVASSLVEFLPVFTSTDPMTFFKDYFTASPYWTFRPVAWEKGFRLALLILGVAGLVRLFRDQRGKIGLALLCATVWLFFLTYFGSFIPGVVGWQPLRFKAPLDLALVVSTAYFLGREALPRRAGLRSAFVVGTVLLAALSSAINIVQTEAVREMTLRTGIPESMIPIIEWIAEDSPRGGRVLFEESGDETHFVYDGAYLSSLIAHLTSRQLIGGPANLYNDRHHFAEFHSGRLFKRDIMSFSDEELREYLRVYNIASIVAFHPRSLDRLLGMPDLIKLDREIEGIALMKVDQPLDWFLEGEGHAEAGFNFIHCTGVEGAEVVLKYHWVEGLVAEPPVMIERVKILDDPIPFIRIIDPPEEFTLRVGR